MHLHHGNDFEEFQKKCVPAICLPSDFGGDLKSVSELHKAHCEEFVRLRHFFIEDEIEASLQK